MAKKNLSPSYHPPSPAQLLLERLDEVDRLMSHQGWDEARENLEDLDHRFPDHPDVLGRLLNVYYEQGDLSSYQGACEKLVKIDPHDADLSLALAGAYMSNGRSALALRAFHRFLGSWPDHPRAIDVRQIADSIQTDLEHSFDALNLGNDEGMQMAIRNDEMQNLLQQGQYRQVISIGEMMIRRWPQFLPAYNNLSQTYWIEGQPDKAVSTARKVLETEPDNIHALANLVRYACLSGDMDQAQAYMQTMKASSAQGFDRSLKIAEALTYLGDDKGVLESFQQLQASSDLKESSLADPMLFHLAAVASHRLGQEQDAFSYWKKALELSPGFDLAKANLADLEKPLTERHVPWAYTLDYWIPARVMSEFFRLLEPQINRKDQEGIQRAARRFLERHPELNTLASVLLERGDVKCREFILTLARMAQAPTLLGVVKDFALGQHGPDALRLEAVQMVTDAGLLPTGMKRMWINGYWTDLLIMGCEIYTEVPHKHSPQVEEWNRLALDALRNGETKQAEELIIKAQVVEPDAPDLINNLAAVYDAQGRQDEAIALIEQIHTRFPDYLFGRTGLAQVSIQRGELERAKELLIPLHQLKHMHTSEFDAYCAAHVELSLAEKNTSVARAWFGMWESANPENMKLERYRHRVIED